MKFLKYISTENINGKINQRTYDCNEYFLFVSGWLIKAVIHWLEGNIPNENTCSYFYALSSSSSRLNRLRPVIACKLVLLGGGGWGGIKGQKKQLPTPEGFVRRLGRLRTTSSFLPVACLTAIFFCKFDRFMQMINDSRALDSSHIWIARGGRNARSVTKGARGVMGRRKTSPVALPLNAHPSLLLIGEW